MNLGIQRRLLCCALMAGLAWFATAQPPSLPQPAPAATWNTFISRQGNFSIFMPAVPQSTVQRFRLQEGAAEEHRFSAPSTAIVYQAAFTYLSENIATPEGINVRFANLLKTLRENPRLKWVSGGQITLDGNPGIEFKFEIPESAVETWSRQYFAYGCVYEVTARYPKKDAALPELSRFIESLKILGPPIQRPPGLASLELPLPDFTPLAQNLFSISSEKLLAQAVKKPVPQVKFTLTPGAPPPTVSVLVTVSEAGKVLAAEPLNGPAALYEESVKTALKWTFTPFLHEGKPIRVQGQLIFKLQPQPN